MISRERRLESARRREHCARSREVGVVGLDQGYDDVERLRDAYAGRLGATDVEEILADDGREGGAR